MQVQPYLMFDGRCEEAVEFYRQALGARVDALLRFKDSPDPKACMPGLSGEKIMHACFRIGDTQIMASDCQPQGAGFHGFSLSISAADDADAQRRFAALADGGQVQVPLMKTFFTSSFGVVADRFGVPWMVVVPTPATVEA